MLDFFTTALKWYVIQDNIHIILAGLIIACGFIVLYTAMNKGFAKQGNSTLREKTIFLTVVMTFIFMFTFAFYMLFLDFKENHAKFLTEIPCVVYAV